MRLATTTGDFYHYAEHEADRVRLFEGTGFRHLDYNFYEVIYPGSPFLGDRWMDEVDAAAKAAEQLGFDFVQAHSPNYNYCDVDFDHEAGILASIRSIEACGYLGIKNIVVHPGIASQYSYPESKKSYFLENKRFYDILIPYAEKHNVNLLIENGAEQNVGKQFDFMTTQDMLDFIEYYNHPLMHACWDVGHANMRGTDPFVDVSHLGKELFALHVQDNFGDFDEHFAPFMGTLPLDSLIQGLLHIDYKGYFTFESSNILAYAGCWPFARKEFPLPQPARVTSPSPALQQRAIALLYEIGKYVLQQYDCFED